MRDSGSYHAFDSKTPVRRGISPYRDIRDGHHSQKFGIIPFGMISIESIFLYRDCVANAGMEEGGGWEQSKFTRYTFVRQQLVYIVDNKISPFLLIY